VLVIVLPPSDSALFTICVSFMFSGGLAVGAASPEKVII